MRKSIVFIFKCIIISINIILFNIQRPIVFIQLYLNGANFSSFRSKGIPFINVSLGGTLIVGKNFWMNNKIFANPIGRVQRCSIVVGNGAKLVIGENVGMSSTAIVCYDNIEIGDNVNLGGNTVIYDTDFHSLNFMDRRNRKKDIENTNTSPVKIGNDVFIGAHTTILKGIEIGENSIVGASSVVTRNVPSNEIWAGNPAKLIRKC